MRRADPRQLIPELCRQFYDLGWCTGTGGGISLREGDAIYMAPSGVQKERIRPEDIFVLNLDGEVLERPEDPSLKLTACAPLFFAAMRQRDAGAVLHSHGVEAVMASMLSAEAFRIRGIEMIKGLRGHGFYDLVEVPIIENTAEECDLRDDLAAAVDAWPKVDAVLVRRHGVYIWGRDWRHAKSQAECYHYLFDLAVKMRAAGLDPTAKVEGR